MPRIPIVIFAQVPPPEHGQSRMVLLALETMRQEPDCFEVHHVNARFSNTLEDIGDSTVSKFLLTARYLWQAIRLRFLTQRPLLYYVPGPVKWSSVIRDLILLSVLRLFYSRVIFHWHAIGHGEWAHGSERLSLDAPKWIDRLLRKISAIVLDRPFASIPVSENSRRDSAAVASANERIIPNGIADPCPQFETELALLRIGRRRELQHSDSPCFRILFLSHGTLQKGIIDALDCMAEVLIHCDSAWKFEVTFAGGISDSVRILFDQKAEALLNSSSGRITIREEGYVKGDAKHRCFVSHDIFLAPSRWESFGLTVLEAMAYGMPVVAAASDGVMGILPEGYPYHAPVANPVVLAEKLRQCCQSIREQPEQELPQALRQLFLDHYQIKYFSENLIRVITELGEIETHKLELEEDRGAQRSVQGRAGKECLEEIVSSPSAAHARVSHLAPLASPSHGLRPLNRHFLSPSPNSQSPISISVYLADQNPGHDRSFGISRMSQAVLEALQLRGGVEIETITSKTSQQAPLSLGSSRMLPWGTRQKWIRLLTDHFHPLFFRGDFMSDIHYFPKGYLPLLSGFCRPSVVTIHDTIIQYDEDHYPKWRRPMEYAYWAKVLKHTLKEADRILTVSKSSKEQIEIFMDRHGIPRKEITVTYEPCLYEEVPQPENPSKETCVIHLASCEPHKRTAHLIRWWHDAEKSDRKLPTLHLIGSVPPEVEAVVASSKSIVKRPFLEDSELRSAYLSAKALILPSEIEGFGLPALEAYYLGTPVCFVKGTSVQEVLSVATTKGSFDLSNSESLYEALAEVIAMDSNEVRECGLKLRESYAANKVAARMLEVFREVAAG